MVGIMMVVVVPVVGASAALVELLGDHGLGQLDCAVDARDGHLALRGARLHLVAI